MTLLFALDLSSPAAYAQNYTDHTLYSFQGGTTDGYYPEGTLIDVNGILYGTTRRGGIAGEDGEGSGTVFSLDPTTNKETTLYRFTWSGSDGALPYAGLVNVNGTLYGTASAGGTYGEGTIFSFNPTTKVERTVYSFVLTGLGMPYDGGQPTTGPINVNGILYGTTDQGGNNKKGVIYSFDPATDTERVLHSFGNSGTTDGTYPNSILVNFNGMLYGTTTYGGSHASQSFPFSFGTIFSINLDGTGYQTRYSFQGNDMDGANPVAGLVDVNGILYGTTTSGTTSITSSGTVFSFDPMTNAEQTIYLFTAGSDGDAPRDALIYDSTSRLLLGTTDQGGSNGSGVVFSIDPITDNEQIVYTFQSSPTDGLAPTDSLLDVNGTLYGTTFQGGGSKDYGTIFSLVPVPVTPPNAASDRYAPKYATAYTVKAPGVLANDKGVGPITATLVTKVTHGTLTFGSDGSFTYTPAVGFVGTDSFTYQAGNAAGKSNTATVSLIIQTSAPVAHNDAYVPTYGHAYKVNSPGVLANDYNGDNQPMTATLISSASHGTLVFNSDGSFLYTATFGYSGTDSFTYTATNPIGTSNTATITFTIHAVVPIAHNDIYAPKYQTAYAVSAPGVLGNDDTGGTTPMTAALVSTVTHGTLTFSSNGSFTYTPSADFIGADTFTYQNTTPTGTGNTATVTLNVIATVPVAHNDAYTVTHNKTFAVPAAKGALANDYAGDTGSLTATRVSTVSHGTLTFNSDGSYSYVPNTGYSGTDTFTYKDTNAIGTSNTATVTLTVQ